MNGRITPCTTARLTGKTGTAGRSGRIFRRRTAPSFFGWARSSRGRTHRARSTRSRWSIAGTPLDLVVVGTSQNGLLEGRVRVGPDLMERVRFAGWVGSYAELRRLYQSAEALVFPSFYEGFGMPPLEAMRLGCPVIASDIPALREVCGDAALYANPHRPAEIARAIRRLMDDPELARVLRERGMRRAAMFTWERCARETLSVLVGVLARKRGRSGCALRMRRA